MHKQRVKRVSSDSPGNTCAIRHVNRHAKMRFFSKALSQTSCNVERKVSQSSNEDEKFKRMVRFAK